MNVKEYWQQMLWLGPENWGGLLFPPETETITDDTDKDELIDVDDEVVAMDADTCDNTTTDSPFKNTHSKNSATAIGNGNTVSDKKTKESDEYAFLDNLLGGSASNKNKAKGKTSTKRDDDDDFEEDDDIDEPEYADEYDREGSDGDADDDVNSPRTSNRNSTDAEKDQDPTDPLLKSSWNMASYLPSAAAIYFKHIVGEYMLQYRKYRNMRLAKKEAFLLSLSQSADTPREVYTNNITHIFIPVIRSYMHICKS